MPGSRKTGKRDVEKVYAGNVFIAKLRRLADALERGGPFRVHIDPHSFQRLDRFLQLHGTQPTFEGNDR